MKNLSPLTSKVSVAYFSVSLYFMWNLSAYLVIHSDNNSSLPQTGQKKKLLLENVKYGGPTQLTFRNPPKQLVKFEKCE